MYISSEKAPGKNGQERGKDKKPPQAGHCYATEPAKVQIIFLGIDQSFLVVLLLKTWSHWVSCAVWVFFFILFCFFVFFLFSKLYFNRYCNHPIHKSKQVKNIEFYFHSFSVLSDPDPPSGNTTRNKPLR